MRSHSDAGVPAEPFIILNDYLGHVHYGLSVFFFFFLGISIEKFSRMAQRQESLPLTSCEGLASGFSMMT